MSNERIDLTWLEGKTATREERIENICGDYDYVENLLSELKRMYERENELLQAIGEWGMVICPRSGQWFEWDYGCQSESCVDEDDCRELIQQQQASK